MENENIKILSVLSNEIESLCSVLRGPAIAGLAANVGTRGLDQILRQLEETHEYFLIVANKYNPIK